LTTVGIIKHFAANFDAALSQNLGDQLMNLLPSYTTGFNEADDHLQMSHNLGWLMIFWGIKAVFGGC